MADSDRGVTNKAMESNNDSDCEDEQVSSSIVLNVATRGLVHNLLLFHLFFPRH